MLSQDAHRVAIDYVSIAGARSARRIGNGCDKINKKIINSTHKID